MKIVKNEDQRVGVFVDVQNMYYSARSLYEAKVNFGNLMEEAISGRKLVRAVAYVITTGEEDEKEKAFFDALYKAGFDIKQKEVQTFKGGAKKGDWDVGICIDAISMAEKLDSIILVSGDGDYVSLVEYLKLAKGCAVEVVAFEQTCSHKLKEVADYYIDIEGNKEKFLIKGWSTQRKSPSKSVGKKDSVKVHLEKPKQSAQPKPRSRGVKKAVKPQSPARPKPKSGGVKQAVKPQTPRQPKQTSGEVKKSARPQAPRQPRPKSGGVRQAVKNLTNRKPVGTK